MINVADYLQAHVGEITGDVGERQHERQEIALLRHRPDAQDLTFQAVILPGSRLAGIHVRPEVHDSGFPRHAAAMDFLEIPLDLPVPRDDVIARRKNQLAANQPVEKAEEPLPAGVRRLELGADGAHEGNAVAPRGESGRKNDIQIMVHDQYHVRFEVAREAGKPQKILRKE